MPRRLPPAGAGAAGRDAPAVASGGPDNAALADNTDSASPDMQVG
ncbi:MAG TPA: hypothetical protein VKZ41_05755 [Gemmatimonadales bacterium]|nr:hypothetical protein [Gemmatimonadales bacterium]